MTILSALAALLAFGLFGLAMDQHHLKRMGSKPSHRRKGRMRTGAWAALLLAFPLAIAAKGWIFGPVLWCGLIMLAAGSVFLALNFLPAGITLSEPHRD